MIYYLSYLYFPSLPITLWLAWKARSVWLRAVVILFVIGTSTLAYARFVEPRILISEEREITLDRCADKGASLKIALFSDTHIGVFGNAMPIDRIASKIESLSPDIALIAGDLVYHIEEDRIADSFRSLAEISTPVYAVLGNHDVGFPGPDIGDTLTKTLSELGLNIIDNQVSELTVNGTAWELIGLSDEWQGQQERNLLSVPMTSPRLVLTHNPDTALSLTENSFDLMLAGHTHGGQILLTESLTCGLMKLACRVTRIGSADTDAGAVFVTSGTGMVGLPMRFRVPPRLDVLTVTAPPCGR